LDVDIGVDNIGIVFEVIGVFEDIFIGVVIGDFDIRVIGVGGDWFDDFLNFVGHWRLAFQAGLFGGLFGGAFRADGGVFPEVEKSCPA
jgi:hypothetical protein